MIPTTLSALIRHGLDCLDVILTKPELYTVDMDKWHAGFPPSKKVPVPAPTRVCLAGAVMAVTLGADPQANLAPSDFPGHWGPLRALNWVQGGYVHSAGEALAVEIRGFDRPLPEYRPDPAGFRTGLLGLADELQQAGL